MSISAKERREIPDSKMGVPGKDKYPLRTPREIKSANMFINSSEYITEKEKKALANKILDRAEEEGMDTSKLHAANKVAGVAEQVPPMSDGTSLGNAPPRMMAPYYDEQDDLFSQLDKMDSRRHVLTFEDAQRIVAEIHAQVEKDSKPPTGNQNCQLCVWCAEAQSRGIKALPRPIYSPRDPALSIVGETIVLHPVRQKIASQRDVIEAVRSNVDSRWYVHVNWAGSEGGHEFLVVNINDYAYIMDPQAGILEEIDETDSPKVKYFMHANYANSYIVRLDNRSFNSTLLNLANNPNRVLPWDPKLDIPYMKAHGMLSDEDYQAAMDMGDLPIQEAACTASLLTVKNQLMNLLGSDFEFIGGSLIPKFTMKSRMKPDVAIEVNIVGPNVEVTPVYKGIPDMLHKRRGIALMQASHVVADFARELVTNYKPKPVNESFMDEYATPAKYVMRKAKESDLDLVYQSELETVGENKDDPKVQRYIKQDAKNSLGHTKIIVVDGKDVGVYQAYETNYYGLREGKRDWWYLAHIYIKPEYRNLGIGSDIIKKDINTHDKILLQVMKSNKRAQKLYESLGFIVDMENDHGGLVMRFDKSKPVQEGADDWIDIGKAPITYFGIPVSINIEALQSIFSSENVDRIFEDISIMVSNFMTKSENLFDKRCFEEVKELMISWDRDSDGENVQEIRNLKYSDAMSVVKPRGIIFEQTDSGSPFLLLSCNCKYDIEHGFAFLINKDGDIAEMGCALAGLNITDKMLEKPLNQKPVKESFMDEYAPYQEGTGIIEKARDMTLMPVRDFKYDKVFYGDPTNGGSVRALNGKPLFVTPYPGLASIFLGRRQIFRQLSQMGYHEVNLGYDEWGELGHCDQPLTDVHVYVKNQPDLKPFTAEYDGYLHTIDCSQLKENIFRYPWMSDPDHEVLIAKVPEVKIENVQRLHIKYHVRGIRGRVPETPYQEGAVQDIKNGVNPFSDKMVFHVSHEKHNDGQVWKPRVPDYLDPYNPEETGFEDNTTPRVCFSTSIEGALNGITVNLPRQNPDQFDKMYVYIPEKPWKEYKHKTTKELVNEKLVYDANVTREVWIMEPVRLKLYGVIKVDQVSNVKRKAVVPTSKGQKGDRNYFTYKWHWVVKPKVLEKGTKFDYSPERVISDLCIDMKKFKYGLIKDGRLQTGNVSEKDYQKYWVFHSSQEVDEAGGGNCWDMVEYEAGYLEAFGVPYKKYFMNFTKTDGKTIINTHTICVVPLNGKFVYLEQAFKRVVDEWGYERQKTFDSLKEIFQYVAEVSAEYDNQDLNYGVWDYTDAKIDYGTPGDDFCKWIMTKCRMIYDGEAKKPTVKKEGYRVSRFGNIFQEEDEKLSETENITIGDLDLGGDDNSDDGPGLPGYIEDRMSDDDLEAYNSDDGDFKIPEEGDFDSFKVSDEKLEEARGPIEPQPDENLDAANVDLGQFGKDTSDVQNEYDPKEVTILMKLMASEADAMNEYMDGAKETNIDVLRRLYADIANEERFHMEQLLYAKCELTGEKYVPKDPDVKSEYEELLKMGMDEETAMQTAVDKCHIRGSITIEDDIDDVDEISKDMETMETAIMMFNALYDSTEMVLESGNASKEDIERAMTVFTEACITQEAVYNATPADSEKSALSKANKHGPIQLLRDTIRFLIRTIMTIIRKFVEATKRISNRSREIRRFIKNNGLGSIFSEKASFYFVNLKFPQAAYVDTHLDTLLGLAADTLQACAYNLNVQLNMQVNVQRDPKLNINNNMQRGAELLQGVQLVKSAFVIPKDNAEQERIAVALFGLSEHYDVDGKTYNTLNTLKLKCDAWSRFMQYTEGFLNELDKLQQNTGSVYYTNRKKYDQAEKCIEAVVKTCKAWVSAIQSDINTIIKLDQKAMIAATEEYEKQSKAVNPHQQRLSENYERNYRTAESSGQKVSKFSRFGR